MLELYHGRTSVCAQKARIALAEKGVTQWVSRLMTLRGDQFDPAYIKLNPNAVVPTLVHDGRPVIESSVICRYIDDAFQGPALMPAAPHDRARVNLMVKLVDEYVHNSCTVLTFATSNRAPLQKLTPAARQEELAKAPDKKRTEAKLQVADLGLDAPLVVDAIAHHVTMLDRIETATASGPWIGGPTYSIGDICATPYVWRLDMLRLAKMWDKRPGVAAWYERIRARPSFDTAVRQWLTPDDTQRYASFQPEPWPKVSEILAAAA